MRTGRVSASLASLLLAAGAAAAPPQQSTAFTYQGVLNASGHPASGNFDLTFRLFDAATNGNQVGTAITLTQFPVANGIFTADLDFPGAFSGSQLWLEVTVGTQTLSPRQPVNAVPVAQYALSGNPGASGAPGKNSLIAQTYEPAGAHCSVAGIKLTSGVDSNGNGVLDAAEVTSTSYLCGSSPPILPPDPTCSHQPITTSAIVEQVIGTPSGTNISPSTGDTVLLQTTPNDPNTCTDGNPVTPFTYTWTLQKPAGSAATISQSNPASFIPDVVGDYFASVTVVDAVGNAVTTQTNVQTTTCGANPILVAIASSPTPSLPTPASLVLNATSDDNNGTCPARFASNFTFEWSVLSAPLPSYWQFSSPTFFNSQFLPSTVGTYLVAASVRNSRGTTGTATVPVTFTEASTMNLTSSLNPAPAGQAVTFTATVTASVAGSGTPTGAVDFFADTAPIAGCSGIALDASTHAAKCTTNALSAGPAHTIEADYRGDANFTTAQGTLQQTLN